MRHGLLLLLLLLLLSFWRESWWSLSRCLWFYNLNWGWERRWCELGVYDAILRVQNLLQLSLQLPLLMLLMLLLLLLLWVVGGHVLEVLQTRAQFMRVLHPTVARRDALTPVGGKERGLM
jgi:hypothetical protein